MAPYINPSGAGFGASPVLQGSSPSPYTQGLGTPRAVGPSQLRSIPAVPPGIFDKIARLPGNPQGQNQNFPTAASPMGNVGAGAIRPTGPSAGYDPSYLQNLAVNEGGLFPNSGGLQFNPLGNLTDIGGTMQTGGGNAPVAGLPPTMLQQSLAANPTFTQGGGNQPINSLAQMLQQAFGGGNGLMQLFGLGNVSGT